MATVSLSGSAKQQQSAEAQQQPQPPKEKPNPHAVQTRWFLTNKGKAIELTLTSGATITGLLSAVDQFSLTLREPDGRLALIYKHAVAVLRPAANGGENGELGKP